MANHSMLGVHHTAMVTVHNGKIACKHGLTGVCLDLLSRFGCTPVSALYDTCIRCIHSSYWYILRWVHHMISASDAYILLTAIYLLLYILQNSVSLFKRQQGLRWTINSLVKCISFLECLESQSFLVVSLWMVASLRRRCSCLLSDTDLDVLQRTLFVSKCSIHQIPRVPIVDCYHKIRQQVINSGTNGQEWTTRGEIYCMYKMIFVVQDHLVAKSSERFDRYLHAKWHKEASEGCFNDSWFSV
jgi:hypothetical protein